MKKALTIGELLITMSVIGVIAVLVLPGFIKDYHNKIYTAKLKKSIEMLENAVNQACIDNNVSYFYQTPYVVPGGKKQQEFIDKYFKKVNTENVRPFANKYKVLNSGKLEDITISQSSHGWGKLASGEAVSLFCKEDVTFCVFRVDINATDGPNIGGKDYFYLRIDRQTNKVYDQESKLCGTTYDGQGCYSKLLENNWIMNY